MILNKLVHHHMSEILAGFTWWHCIVLIVIIALSVHLITRKAGATTLPNKPEKVAPIAAWSESFDHNKEVKLPWSMEGYHTWTWRGHKVNYIEMGAERTGRKPPLLLIHGFGASSYHWRFNIPILARKYHVFAIDLLGFGSSDKPVMDYTADVWRDQTLDFIAEVMHPATDKQEVVVAGNSLGGYTALFASASPRATEENLIKGCILLNSAGKFKKPGHVHSKKEEYHILKYVRTRVQRFVIGLCFLYTKQPARIAQVLRQVYSVDTANVDEDLVASIHLPAQHPNAAEVFFRILSCNAAGPLHFVDDLLPEMKLPLMLLWGMKDPWIRPVNADRIQALRPDVVRVDLDAGHCPHDEVPHLVNDAISDFVESIYK